MNGVMRNVVRISKLRPNWNTLNPVSFHSMRHMSSTNQNDHFMVEKIKYNNSINSISKRLQHTKAEKELVEFLAEEIVAEKKAQKLKTIPTELNGFRVSLDGANVTLTKQNEDEKITIAFNVNHTVNTDNNEAEIDMNDDKPEFGEMKSKPNFTVDIVRGKQTLGFSCSFNDEPGASGADESYNDCFGIDEITMYEGDHNDKTYAVAGEVIDGYLYDLLMNYLEEKGISNEFAEKMAELSTSYEHSAYISLLEGLSKFTGRK